MLVADEVSSPVDSGNSGNGQAGATLLTGLVGKPEVETKRAQFHDHNLSEAGRLAKYALSGGAASYGASILRRARPNSRKRR